MLIFGIDKFMSECRALVNFIGNAVATLFVAKWNRELDVTRARAVFAGKDVEPLFDPSEDLDVNPYDPADHELVRANHGQLAMAGAAPTSVGGSEPLGPNGSRVDGAAHRTRRRRLSRRTRLTRPPHCTSHRRRNIP